jgi:hypothetical protein
MAHRGLPNHLGDASKKENDTAVPPPPDPKTESRFPPMFDAGKSEQHHDDASNKVTAPAGVAVASLRRDFSSVLPPNPSPSEKRRKEPSFGHTAVEKQHCHRRRGRC